MNYIKQVDFFRKAREEIDTKTQAGGILSFAALICGLILFISEIQLYRKSVTVTNMYIDSRQEDLLQINLDITFLKSPCEVISIDLEDELGNRQLGVHQNITFTEIINGVQGEVIQQPEGSGTEEQAKMVIEKINKGIQCQAVGFLEAKRTPGNFQFGFSKHGNVVQRIGRIDRQASLKLDIDFKINGLTFGHGEKIVRSRSPFGRGRSYNLLKYSEIDENYLNYYQGLEFSGDGKYQYELHLFLLPVWLFTTDTQVYQFNAYSSQLQKRPEDLGQAFFRYHINSINIKYSMETRSIYKFIVSMLAIIGGIFALTGMIYTYALKLVKKATRQ